LPDERPKLVTRNPKPASVPDIIHLLPDSIANQIAAGEVVQRPASAVKELLENSIDAGAKKIQLIIRDAGKQLIQIIDDGAGMSETDARMSLERHATSKIKTAEDLFKLRTMGFRGEALASIAAVSQMELRTRQAHQELGTLIVVEGSEIKKQEPVASPAGTTIHVKNLFYNIPARRNFLKGNSVEMKHIVDAFVQQALARPDIAFMLVHGDEVLFDVAPAKLSQRIIGLFGKGYQEQLAACSLETDLMKVTGYVGRPESAKRTRGEQFLFVNNRFIRNNYLHHAVMNGFEGLLPEGSFPFYTLFIDIDPKHVDVNVHPTKTEIKFDDERSVYAYIRAAVKQALGTHNLSPSLDFAGDVNLTKKLSGMPEQSHAQFYQEQIKGAPNRNVENWERLFENLPVERLTSQTENQSLESTGQILRLESSINQDLKTGPSEKVLFQLQQKFIIREVSNGLMIINQQSAHERVLFDKFMKQLSQSNGASQQALFPQTAEFSSSDFSLLMELENELNSLGFRFEVFGKTAILIQGLPVEATGKEKEVLEGLLEQFKFNRAELQLPAKENLARSLARRMSVKTGQKLSPEQMTGLVAGLFSSSNPGFSPDGSTTFFIFETSKMEGYFR
jgi:DNA mismatch repair protein MutL